eukprot:2296127-Rhodomonas_salina.1
MVSCCASITSSMCLGTRAMAAPCSCHLLNTKAVTSRWRGTAGVFVSDNSRGKEGSFKRVLIPPSEPGSASSSS